jgi:hypothetical protein
MLSSTTLFWCIFLAKSQRQSAQTGRATSFAQYEKESDDVDIWTTFNYIQVHQADGMVLTVRPESRQRQRPIKSNI